MRFTRKIGFKPYYKWITLNTEKARENEEDKYKSFKPYYKWITLNTQSMMCGRTCTTLRFKPYYKWITLNTQNELSKHFTKLLVLNLIING